MSSHQLIAVNPDLSRAWNVWKARHLPIGVNESRPAVVAIRDAFYHGAACIFDQISAAREAEFPDAAGPIDRLLDGYDKELKAYCEARERRP